MPSSDADRASERSIPPLPAIDTSPESWRFVASAFVVECLLWGQVFSSGIFLKYLATTPPFSSSSETQISLIGSLSLLFGYSAGLPLIYVYNRFPRLIKPTLWLGLAMNTVSLLAASFVRNVPGLVVLQGIFPGLAAALCAFPIIRWIPEWFDTKKGTAIGIVFSGGGVGGVFMPLLHQYLLDKVGYGWTLRILALYMAVAAGIAAFFVNPRIPISSTMHIARQPMQSLRKAFLSAGFLGCFFTTLMQGFGYFNVGLFLPRFTDTLDATLAAGLLSAFNFSQVIAQILWGYLTDRMRPATAMAISSTIGCVLVVTLWGFGGEVGLPLLAPFAITFGLAAGGFSSMWSQSAHGIAGPDKELQTLLVAGWSIARAIGATVGPTIGATLYQPTPTGTPKSWGSAGSPGLVSLVAASLAVSAVSGLVTTHVPEMKQLLIRIARTLKHQSASTPTSTTEDATVQATVDDEYEMKPIQDSCLDRISSLPRV
ncbi:hypothetical protein NliqN6_4536 [Naganishia liquefaciens]|uniref:MFS transporter n=1 Tax=Naganishia liquefaciens TaxID=104408 RepID=A0A8H3YFZ1_9TREE|nr:hypothetical protein NliqN6_4536 [Naganishia liquefaciens]